MKESIEVAIERAPCRPAVPPKPKNLVNKTPTECYKFDSLLTAAEDSLSLSSNYSEINTSEMKDTNNSLSLLDEIYAEIEEKHHVQMRKSLDRIHHSTTSTTTKIESVDQSTNLSSCSSAYISCSSSSSTTSSCSYSDISTKYAETTSTEPPPLPIQPPPRLSQIAKRTPPPPVPPPPVHRTTRSSPVSTDTNDAKYENLNKIAETDESSYLEPVETAPIRPQRKSLGSSNIKMGTEASESKPRSIFRASNKLTNTLKLMRTKSLVNAQPMAPQRSLTTNKSASLLSRLSLGGQSKKSSSVKAIEIGAPTLISQTFDMSKQSLIPLQHRPSSINVQLSSPLECYSDEQNNHHQLSRTHSSNSSSSLSSSSITYDSHNNQQKVEQMEQNANNELIINTTTQFLNQSSTSQLDSFNDSIYENGTIETRNQPNFQNFFRIFSKFSFIFPEIS